MNSLNRLFLPSNLNLFDLLSRDIFLPQDIYGIQWWQNDNLWKEGKKVWNFSGLFELNKRFYLFRYFGWSSKAVFWILKYIIQNWSLNCVCKFILYIYCKSSWFIYISTVKLICGYNNLLASHDKLKDREL